MKYIAKLKHSEKTLSFGIVTVILYLLYTFTCTTKFGFRLLSQTIVYLFLHTTLTLLFVIIGKIQIPKLCILWNLHYSPVGCSCRSILL